jgi:hypothetical protein
MAKIIKKHSKKALILVIAFLLVVGYFSISSSQAATITNREVRISDSRPSQTGVIYDFLGDTSEVTTKCIRMRFCTSADTNGTCTVPTGLDTTSATKETTGWNVFNPANWTIDNTTNGDVKLTSTTGENGGNSSSWVIGNITNPSTANTTFYVWINTYANTDCSTGPIDNGVVAFATVSGVTVSATILESLSFSVSGVTADNCPITGSASKINTTPTAVSYGTVNTEDFYDGCQSLTVSTNANSGYTVTIQETDQLTDPSTGSQIPDGNCDGSCNETTSAPWNTDTNNGFAYCMKDINGDAAATAQPVNWASSKQCGNASQSFMIIPEKNVDNPDTADIMKSNEPVSGDNSYVGFRLSVDAAQQAGSYSTTIIYVATPRY